MKTADDFRQAAQQRNIERWDTRICGICGEPVGYVFIDGHVYFDSCCGCSSYYTEPQRRTWDDVAELYQMNTHNLKWIEATNQFWGWGDA